MDRVCNLEVEEDETYLAEGIIVHNCRSTMVSVLDGEGIAANAVRPAKGAVEVGPVPAKTTYGDFLKDQPESFQNEVLGAERAELWRSGRVEIDQFVDRAGNELTLNELRERHPE